MGAPPRHVPQLPNDSLTTEGHWPCGQVWAWPGLLGHLGLLPHPLLVPQAEPGTPWAKQARRWVCGAKPVVTKPNGAEQGLEKNRSCSLPILLTHLGRRGRPAWGSRLGPALAVAATWGVNQRKNRAHPSPANGGLGRPFSSSPHFREEFGFPGT